MFSGALKVHFIVLFVILFIEEGNAEVVEIETDNRRQAVEPLAMAVQIVKQKHRLLPKVV